MRKIAITLIAVLVAVYALLSLVSRDKAYEAERLFYRANEAYGKIKINPDVAPPSVLSSTEKDFEKIITKYPETQPAVSANIALAEIYIKNKKYEEAIALLDRFIASKSKNKAAMSGAYFLKAVAYEKNNQWNKALPVFEELKERYVDTTFGLQAPLYIAGHYAIAKNEAEAEKAFRKAAVFYRDLAEKNPGTLLGYASSNFLIQAHFGLHEYEKAGEVVSGIIASYPPEVTLAQQLPYVEFIYVKNLNRPEKAIEIYERVSANSENDDLKKFLQGRIKELNSKK